MIRTIFFLLLIGIPHILPAQSRGYTPSPEDSRIFRQVWEKVQHQGVPFSEIVRQTALLFEGKPYVAGLLDREDEETLVCSLNGFDCVLFVETVLALARSIALQDTTWEGFARRVEQLRYRGGMRAGYCSRMHYFSEWLVDNERRGYIRLLRDLPGQVPFDTQVHYMSTHRGQYPRLAVDSTYACIQRVEAHVGTLQLTYVPEAAISRIYPYLRDGDIVAFTTSVEGLDISHTGIILKTSGGGVGVIHASTRGAVMRSPDLEAYVRSVSTQTGVIIARPISPVERQYGQ